MSAFKMNNNVYPCFAHFAPNCPICFPTNVAVQTPVSSNESGQVMSPGPGAPVVALSITTVSPVITTAPPSANGINTLVLPVTDGVSSSAAQEPEETDDDKGTKRKRSDVKYMPYLLPRRKKKTIIDCPVAQNVFRNLRLNNKFFNSGRVLAWGLQPDDPNFRDIYEYVAKGQAHSYGIKIISIIKIVAKALDIESEEIPFDFNDDLYTREKYRMMLWHGTSKQAVTSILENGLRLPIHTHGGSMYGQGIYFADRISKSAQYCRWGIREGNFAFLFLCDVLLGRMYKSNCAMNHLKSPPPTISSDGKELRNDSVKGCGRQVPDKTGEKVVDGCVWPLGETINNTEDQRPLSLNFNEYVVYNTNSVRPQYLVKVEFTNDPYYEKIE